MPLLGQGQYCRVASGPHAGKFVIIHHVQDNPLIIGDGQPYYDCLRCGTGSAETTKFLASEVEAATPTFPPGGIITHPRW